MLAGAEVADREGAGEVRADGGEALAGPAGDPDVDRLGAGRRGDVDGDRVGDQPAAGGVPRGVAYLPSSINVDIFIIEKSGKGSSPARAKSARMSAAVALAAR